jgi:hypothetical protein
VPFALLTAAGAQIPGSRLGLRLEAKAMTIDAIHVLSLKSSEEVLTLKQ